MNFLSKIIDHLQASGKLFYKAMTETFAVPKPKWVRPDEPGNLTPEQALFLREHAACPYCHSPIYEGPEGGLSVNVFCGNPDCDSRFNVIMIGMVAFAGRSSATPAWGEFTGRCPKSFIEQRRAEIATADEPVA